MLFIGGIFKGPQRVNSVFGRFKKGFLVCHPDAKAIIWLVGVRITTGFNDFFSPFLSFLAKICLLFWRLILPVCSLAELRWYFCVWSHLFSNVDFFWRYLNMCLKGPFSQLTSIKCPSMKRCSLLARV